MNTKKEYRWNDINEGGGVGWRDLSRLLGGRHIYTWLSVSHHVLHNVEAES
jgi:hypothetical protein